MKKFTVDIKVGDEVLVGRFRNVSAKIKDINIDEKGLKVELDGENQIFGFIKRTNLSNDKNRFYPTNWKNFKYKRAMSLLDW